MLCERLSVLFVCVVGVVLFVCAFCKRSVSRCGSMLCCLCFNGFVCWCVVSLFVCVFVFGCCVVVWFYNVVPC